MASWWYRTRVIPTEFIVGFTEMIFKIFVLFSVYSDWLRVNHLRFLKQRKGSDFLDIFSHQKLIV